MRKLEMRELIEKTGRITFLIAATERGIKNNKDSAIIRGELLHILDKVNDIYDDLKGIYEDEFEVKIISEIVE